MKIIKRTAAVFASCILIICCIGVFSTPSYATTNVKSAKSNYSKALNNESSAWAKYNKANKRLATGAYGFYQWIIDNNTGWKKADAQEALTVLNTSSFKKYTKKGNSEDATNLNNMRKAINLLPTLQSKRSNDKNFTNLLPPTVRNVYMARAEVNANASSYTFNHMANDNACNLGIACENLAWCYDNPFTGWYDEELVNYNKVRDYTLNKYKVDINTPEWTQFINRESFDYDAYLNETKRFGEIGHYGNVCLNGSVICEDDRVYDKTADIVLFGIAYSDYGGCHCLEADVDTYPEGYTISEYRTLFNRYYDLVYPKDEIAAYNKAKKSTKGALNTLKKVSTPKKPTKANRSKIKIQVKWKKVTGVDGYQISASPKKNKVKIVAKVGKNAKKKTVKISKSRKHFVKIRSFTKVNGKTIYSNWSPVRATK